MLGNQDTLGKSKPENWEEIIMWEKAANIVTVLSLPIGFLGLIGLIWQVREGAKARLAQAMNDILDEIGCEEVRKARYMILVNPGRIPQDAHNTEGLTKSEQELIIAYRRVAVAYDRLGFFIQHRLVPDRPFFDWHGLEIKKLWDKLQPLVKSVQTSEGRHDYAKSFKYLGTIWFPALEEISRSRGLFNAWHRFVWLCRQWEIFSGAVYIYRRLTK
ncbi:MAG: hypothetical protein AB1696_17950 [Planctomycetota bacterium]